MILIISADNDTVTDTICNWLLFQKKKFIRINSSQPIADIHFDFVHDLFYISVDQKKIDLYNITSVFYRNGNIIFENFFGEIDEDLQKFFFSEFKSIANFISYFLEKTGAKIYGNLLVKEVNKLQVLHIAKQLDFKIPETFIFSSHKNLAFIDTNSRSFITKAVSEMQPIINNDGLFLNYTKDIKFTDLKNKEQNLIPTIIQEKIQKKYELRVFFFENEVWAIATFDFCGDTDVRNMKTMEKKYIPFSLPEEIIEKILSLKNELSLNCGTIDLLKTENEYYFLEVNPLGQFREVSYYGNYNIEKYIADLL